MCDSAIILAKTEMGRGGAQTHSVSAIMQTARVIPLFGKFACQIFQPESHQRGQIQRLKLAEVKSSSQLVVTRFSHDIKPNYNLNQFFCCCCF